MVPDLVAASAQYTAPDVLDFAHWDGVAGTSDPAIPANRWNDHQRIKQYKGGHGETYGGTSIDIDSDLLDVGAGSTPPPAKKGTKLTSTGPASVANGSAATLSAKLADEDGKAVGGRAVSFALGSGDTEQTCKGTTDAQGAASCGITSVKQPLTSDATVPVTAEFAGDDAYKASKTSATAELTYVSGRAYGLSANLPLVAIKPTPDTGDVRTADATSVSPPCAQNIGALLVTAGTLCAKLSTSTAPGGATATASVEEASIGLLGLPVIGLSGVKSTSTSTCQAQSGSVGLTLTVAGTPIDIGDTPNLDVDLGVLGTKLVVNEQTRTADGGLTVNAAHLTAPGGVDVVIASSTTGAHNCA